MAPHERPQLFQDLFRGFGEKLTEKIQKEGRRLWPLEEYKAVASISSNSVKVTFEHPRNPNFSVRLVHSLGPLTSNEKLLLRQGLYAICREKGFSTSVAHHTRFSFDAHEEILSEEHASTEFTERFEGLFRGFPPKHARRNSGRER